MRRPTPASPDAALANALRELSLTVQTGSSLNVDASCLTPNRAHDAPCASGQVAHMTPSPIESPCNPNVCAICLSPVRKGRLARSRGVSPAASAVASSPVASSPQCRGPSFRTPCCRQLFHKECLRRYKQGVVGGLGTACPLCRSEHATGLTPSRTMGGFVSSLAVHTAMLRRVSTARAAVQRSLAAGGGPAAHSAASPAPPAATGGGAAHLFFSPGGAYQDVVQQQQQQPQPQRPAPPQE